MEGSEGEGGAGGGEGGVCSGVVGGGVGDGTIGLLALAIRLPRYSGMEVAGADAAEGVVAGEAPAWAAW